MQSADQFHASSVAGTGWRRPAAPGTASGSSLGTTAKFQATSSRKGFGGFGVSTIDPKTGEIITRSPSGQTVRDAAECRLERFALQSVVRDLLPDSRTAKCLRWRQKGKEIQVWKSIQYKRAHYKGLQVCSSVWACPVCAAKISERRRSDLQTLIAAHEAAGGVVLLNTRTVPHKRTDDLGELLDQMAKAESGYKAHRDYKRLSKAFGLVGTVRAVEVTYGSNGWHPHVHELMFLSLPVVVADLEEDLFRLWQPAAVRAGFEAPSRAHGLQLQDGSKAAKYASKWGLESELTQWHRKRGKVESRTPFDLLRQVLATGDKQAGQLFRIYAEQFHGRHQLQFSRGLKKLYNVAETSDEELAHRLDDDAQLLGQLDLVQWRLICRTGQRGALLEVAASVGWDAVLKMIDDLKTHPTREKEAPPC